MMQSNEKLQNPINKMPLEHHQHEQWWVAHNNFYTAAQSSSSVTASRVLSRRALALRQHTVPIAAAGKGSGGRAARGATGSCALCRLARKDWPFCGVNGEPHGMIASAHELAK
jgi:hypothetical protein